MKGTFFKILRDTSREAFTSSNLNSTTSEEVSNLQPLEVVTVRSAKDHELFNYQILVFVELMREHILDCTVYSTVK